MQITLIPAVIITILKTPFIKISFLDLAYSVMLVDNLIETSSIGIKFSMRKNN